MKSLGSCAGRRCGQRTGGTSGVEEFAPGEKGFDQEGKNIAEAVLVMLNISVSGTGPRRGP